ncbi:MAG: right-handed parallel beta-helix repeat-containing protein [Phycisphaerales bacterium]|jgi:hypothetical protein
MRPILLALWCLSVAATAAADQLFVPSPEYPTIQSAVDAAVDGDEVVLRDGVFHPRNIVMPNTAMVIRSESGDPTRVTLLGTRDASGDPSRAFVFSEASSSDIVVRDLTIAGFHHSRSGGAIDIRVASPTFHNCVFVDNRATNYGALVSARGGALMERGSSAVFIECEFIGNSAAGFVCDAGVGQGFGGAVATQGDVTFIGCTFESNRASGACDGSGRGGAIYCGGGSPRFVNCVFNDNEAIKGSGDVAWVEYSSASFTGVTSVAQAVGQGDLFCLDGQLRICGSILRGSGEPVRGFRSAITIASSNVEGGFPGEGNIDADPLFEPGTYRLLPGSPCIDAGNTDLLPPDEFDLDGDGDTAEPIPFDADGLARVVDDPATPDTGVGTPVVDMGAFEYRPPCRADLTGDGVLDVFDFLAFFNAFDDADPVADFDGDGEFTLFDFLAFQDAFDAGCP